MRCLNLRLSWVNQQVSEVFIKIKVWWSSSLDIFSSWEPFSKFQRRKNLIKQWLLKSSMGFFIKRFWMIESWLSVVNAVVFTWFSLKLHDGPMHLSPLLFSFALWSLISIDWIMIIFFLNDSIYCYLQECLLKDPCGAMHEDLSMFNLVMWNSILCWRMHVMTYSKHVKSYYGWHEFLVKWCSTISFYLVVTYYDDLKFKCLVTINERILPWEYMF